MMTALFDQILGDLAPNTGGADCNKRTAPARRATRDVHFAAAISAPGIAIAGVTQRENQAHLVRDKSRCFVQEGMTQQAFQNLSRELQAFIDSRQITQLFVRGLSTAPHRHASAGSTQIAALLNLIEGLRIETVSFVTLSHWRRHGRLRLPEPLEIELPDALPHSVGFKLYDMAIECAAYAGRDISKKESTKSNVRR